MKIFYLYILISFVLLSLFSFLAVSFDLQRFHLCIASLNSGTECPAKTDVVGFLNFHLNALKKFSLAVYKLPGFVFILITSFLICFLFFSQRVFLRLNLKPENICLIDYCIGIFRFISWNNFSIRSPGF